MELVKVEREDLVQTRLLVETVETVVLKVRVQMMVLMLNVLVVKVVNRVLRYVKEVEFHSH